MFVFVYFLLSINGTYAENDARKDFQNALELSLNDLNEAEKAFKNFKLKYPNNDKIRDAEYWLARILFMKQKYSESALAFAEFNAKYPDDKRYEEISLLIAEATHFYAPKEFLCKIYKQTIESIENPTTTFSSRIKELQNMDGCIKKGFKSAASNQTKYTNQRTTNPFKTKLSDLKDERLCFLATSVVAHKSKKTYVWSNLPFDEKFVEEAKFRGLSCGVKEKNEIVIGANQTKDPSKRPLAYLSDSTVCYNATTTSGGKKVWNDRNNNFVDESKYRGLDCGVTEKDKTVIASKPKNIKPSVSSAELEKERAKRLEEERKRKSLEQKLAALEKEKQKRLELEKKLAALQSEKKKQIKKAKQKEIGSGFYVSKFRHIVTNQHVVNQCKKITVGDSMTTQIPADLIASDKKNDLAILQTISMDMASAETKSFIQNLSMQIVPIVSGGLIRIEDVKGGEQVYVAGFPHGNMISDSMRLVPGLVNSTRGFENDITQFETDAVIRKGNSGGPVYDSKGNIVGIAVKRFNVTRSDNYNFAIKGSTVKQFLDAHNILTTPANRTSSMTSTKIYNIASKQTVMVVCHR